MRGSHVSQLLSYVSCTWISDAIGVCDLSCVSASWVGSGFPPSVNILCFQPGLDIYEHFPSQHSLFSSDFISVMGACVSPMTRGNSWLGFMDLPAMGGGLHIGAGCKQSYKLMDVSQALITHLLS